MAMMSNLGKLLIVVGGVLIVIGVVLWLWPTLFRWFGRLPGDIVIRRDGFVFYAPITSMLLLSLLISLLLGLISKLMR